MTRRQRGMSHAVRRIKAWTGVGLLLGAVSWSFPAGAKGDGTSTGWILEQNSPNTGACTIYVAPGAVKIVSGSYGFKMVCKAPDWKIRAFREQEKISWTADVNKFDGGMMVRPLSGATIKDEILNRAQEEFKDGLRCRLYSNNATKTEKLWVAEDIAISAQGADFLRRFYSCPITSKVPVARTRFLTAQKKPKRDAWVTDYQFTEGSGWRDFIRTVSCKKATFLPSEFAVPTGLKQQTFLSQITFSKGKMSDLTDALDALGFREDKKSAK